MKWCVFTLLLCLCGPGVSSAQNQQTFLPDAPSPQPGTITGTIEDLNSDVVSGANVALENAASKNQRTAVSNDNGFFQFNGIQPATPYHVTVTALGFASWTSPDVTLKPGQFVILPVPKLRIVAALTKVTVGYTPEEVATQQVKVEEQQRIFGFVPNFYVAYDHDAAPLTAKLKFELARKVALDPITFAGVAIYAGINQVGDTPNYRQGAVGYAERYGAAYTDGFTDIMIGGALLPSLLHQDPRYFYQGTGTNKSRAFHAMASAFICKGDNGKWQPNYSTMGGDLASAAISNAYYPASNRGVGLFLTNFLVGTGQRAAANLAQEFILKKLTSKPKDRK